MWLPSPAGGSWQQPEVICLHTQLMPLRSRVPSGSVPRCRNLLAPVSTGQVAVLDSGPLANPR
jgi:hypothetical protein